MALKIERERRVKDRFLLLLELLAVRRAGTKGVRQRKDKRVGKRGSLHGIGFSVKLGSECWVKPLFREKTIAQAVRRARNGEFIGAPGHFLQVLAGNIAPCPARVADGPLWRETAAKHQGDGEAGNY